MKTCTKDAINCAGHGFLNATNLAANARRIQTEE